jgi:hypothetical protein
MVTLISPITQVDSSNFYTLGSRTIDKNGNEFIYLKGNSSGTTYGLVSYDEVYATSAVDTDTAASLMGSMAIAMANIDSTSEYGWYQIKGTGTAIANNAVAASARLQPTSTAGYVDDTTTGNIVIVGLWSGAVGAASLSQFAVQLNYPKLVDVTLS